MAHSSLVGRAAELAEFDGALARIESGRGQVMAITGEAGIGKTRLLADLADRAGNQSNLVLWSQMLETPGAPPYSLWIPVLRKCVQGLDESTFSKKFGDIRLELSVVLPELGRGSKAPVVDETSPGSDHYRLFDAVSRVLLHQVERHHLVLLLDNLQIADQSSLALLRYFCQQIPNAPVLVALACRDSDLSRNSPVKSTLRALSTGAAFTKLVLSGISKDDVAEMLLRQVGQLPSESVIVSVYQQSGGNPLFVSEVGAMLAQQPSGSLESGANLHFHIPDSLTEVISARLESLPASTFKMLEIAAVLGREFDVALLCAISGKRLDHVHSQLKDAEAEGVISSTGLSRYQFYHVLYREFLYGELSAATRAYWHLKAGEYLEVQYQDGKLVSLAQLAYHFFEATPASDPGQTADYCVQAAGAAIAGRAYSEATVLYERALQVLEFESESNSSRRFEIQIAMGKSQYQSGQLNAATHSMLKAALLAHHLRWWNRLAEALIAFQSYCQQSGLRHVVSVPLHKILQKHLPPDETTLHARVSASLANAYRMAAKPELAKDSFQQGVKLARESGDPNVLLTCLIKGAWVVGRDRHGAEKGLAIAEESLQLAKQLRKPKLIVDALTDILFQLSDLGRIDELALTLTELRQQAEQEHLVHFLAIHKGFEAAIAILRGRWTDAIRLAQSGLSQTPVRGVFGLEGRYAFQMFAIKKAQGSLDEVADQVKRMIEENPDAELWLPGQILLHCEVGQESLARAALERLGDLDQLPRDDLYTIALIYLAESCAKLQDVSRCQRLYELLLPYRGLNASLGGTIMVGAVSGYLAILAVTNGEGDAARALFEEAMAMNEAMGAAPALAQFAVEFARFLFASDDSQDHARARQLLARARTIANKYELGAVREALRSVSETSQEDELTSREVEVLKLVAGGRSNKEISESLHISHSTVATHIRHILQKTGTKNRTEAAEHARQAHLLGDP